MVRRPSPFPWRLVLTCAVAAGTLFGSAVARAGDCPALLRHTFPSLQDNTPQNLCQYKGKVILVVNSASYCGYTNQYDGLEALYERLKDRGFVILGFPSNDFGGQEPGSNKEIADFCRLTYGVRYPMMAKTSVSGRNANPFHAALAKRTGAAAQWNFHKYLIDRNGDQVLSFRSTVGPDDKQLHARIDEFLKRPTPQP